ncbi:cohesin-associated protein Pds5 [Mycena rosella]|uniref:Cohesin-associated protein Pds5 n=1 Tax=Mycena rosella TaxID=1033263 RepID=A0AAD7DMP7_MYCRO|nr:cohesin-associated protein Pds5 [Mycena rosella]
MVAQTRHAAPPSPQKLAFRDKLVGKGLSTDALIKKLQVLHRELAELDQELVDASSLGGVRKELISTTTLHHKDQGVKAYTACCLADILRLTAPDAPYTQGELRDIFQFFFRQLKTGLKGSDSPYYTEFFHLLESLSTVKSVVLVCDLPNADELMAEIFRDFFTLVRRDLPKKVEMFLSDILVALIDECQALPAEVLESLIAQFMDKNARIEQPAYRLAVQVCNATADKLTRHVSQYFTEIIVAERDEDLSEIRNAHELIKRLYHSCPAVLPTVIPQLEEELQADDLQLRLIVTQALGEMFADSVGGPELTKNYQSTWNMWLKRRNDKAPAVRLKFVETALALLGSAPEQRDAVEDALKSKLLDPDDKVRAAVCRVYAQLDYETALHHVKTDQLRAVADRGVDKKHSVRAEALRALGKLYSLAYPEIENKDNAAIVQFAWIPNEMFQMIKVTNEIRPLVEDVVAEYILPLPSSSTPSTSKGAEIDEVAWTDRLLTVMAFLDDDHAVNTLITISALQRSRPTIFEHFVESCILNNGGVIDENEEAITAKLSTVIKYISGGHPEPHKASEDLYAFAKLNEQRLYKLLKTCMDLQTDLKGLVKATNEFVKRMDTVSSSIAPTMNFILRQASLRIVNQSSVPTLLKRLQKANHLAADNAAKLLRFVSKHIPALYKSHVGELVKGVADEKHPQVVEVSLQALAAVVRWDEKVVPTDKRTLERIRRLAVEGTFRQAKFAARFLAFSRQKATVCTEVVEVICEALGTTSPELLVAHVAVLAQFARFTPDAFEHKSDVLTAFLLKELLMVPTHPLDDAMDTEEEWADESEVSDNLRAKILALKVCRNRSLAHASSENALEIATPVLKMLATLLEHGGSFIAESGEDPKVMSRMRLQAAVSLLHLSTVPAYAIAIAPRFLKLAIVVQDTCFDVRMTFLKKVVFFLQPPKVPAHYNVIPFLTVHDPEADVKALAMSYVNGVVRKASAGSDSTFVHVFVIEADHLVAKRVQNMEMMFIRLLHLLAHHPDFATSQEELLDIAKYIQFYLQQVANADTISLLYHLAVKGKTVRDADEEHTENLYVICELAQELIKLWAHSHSLNLTTYPGKIKLPQDILRPLANADKVNKNVKTIYLSDQMMAWVKEQYSSTKEKKEKKDKERAEKASAKRKAHPKTNGNPAKKRKRRHSGHSEDDFGSETDEDADPEERSDPVVPEDSEEEEEPEPSGEERLGRGQRIRAKRKQAKAASKKAKHSSPTPEG